MSKKIILIITDNTREQVNGVVTTFNSIEKEAIKDNYAFEWIDSSLFPSIPAPRYPEVRLSFPFGLWQTLNETVYDHVHIATEGPIGLFARLYFDFKKIRYNTSYHTKFPEFIKKIYGIPEKLTYSYLRWFHKHSGVVLANTDSMVQLLRQKKFDGEMRTWTRGVDFTNLNPTIENQQDNSVLYVGRVSKEKNLDALCQLQNKFKIVIVGDGPYRKQLQEKYRDVEFVGYKKGQLLANYYRKASCFAFPSKEDTFGIVMIEAMSLGCPVAAYPVTGPIDVLKENVTGCLDENLEKAIEKALLLDRSVVEAEGKQWTWQKSWQQFKKSLVDL